MSTYSISTNRLRATHIALAFIFVALLALLIRGPGIRSPMLLNPDEAELLAEGSTAARALLPPYGSYTGTTHLLLWPLSLGLLAKFGVSLTLQTAHALSALAYVFVIWVGWCVLARRLGWLWSAIFVLPIGIHVLAVWGEFWALGTELLPIAFILAGAAVLLWSDRQPGTIRLAAAAALAGLAPWAKPQSVLLSLSLLVVAMGWAYASRRGVGGFRSVRRDLVILAVAYVSPTGLFLLIMMTGGTFSTFIDEPVAFQIFYLTERDQVHGGVTPPFFERTRMVTDFVFLLANAPALLWSVGGLVNVRRDSDGGWMMPRISLIVWCTPMIAAVTTLFLAAPMYPHYANFLYAGGLLSAMAGRAMPRIGMHELRHQILSPLNVLLAATLLTILVVVGFRAIKDSLDDLRSPVPSYLDTALAAACPPQSRVHVWGWASELYVYQSWEPASRYVNAVWQIIDTPNAPYYRESLLEELRDDPPVCIVEALGPAFYGDFDPESHAVTAVMPTISPLLAKCFAGELVSLTRGSEIQVWRRIPTCSS